MNTDPDSSSRFRKGGLTRSLNAAAACAAGAAALLTADASIILTDHVDLSVEVTNPAYQEHNTFIQGGGGAGLQLYSVYTSKVGYQVTHLNALFRTKVVDDLSYSVTQMGAGVSVDASLFYGNSGGIAMPEQHTHWLTRGDSGFFGFSFNFSDSLPLLYGWGELIRSASGPDTMTLTRYAYEDSGAAILTGDAGGAVPEPEDYAVAAGAGLLVMAGVRRWRRSASLSQRERARVRENATLHRKV